MLKKVERVYNLLKPNSTIFFSLPPQFSAILNWNKFRYSISKIIASHNFVQVHSESIYEMKKKKIWLDVQNTPEHTAISHKKKLFE